MPRPCGNNFTRQRSNATHCNSLKPHSTTPDLNTCRVCLAESVKLCKTKRACVFVFQQEEVVSSGQNKMKAKGGGRSLRLHLTLGLGSIEGIGGVGRAEENLDASVPLLRRVLHTESNTRVGCSSLSTHKKECRLSTPPVSITLRAYESERSP